MPSRRFNWKVCANDDYACPLGNSASSPLQWGQSLPWPCRRDRQYTSRRIRQGTCPVTMYFPCHPNWYVTTCHLTWALLQKVITCYRRMARKLSCMSTDDVQVPPQPSQSHQTRTNQRLVRQGQRLRYRRSPEQEEGMTKQMTIVMMMTSMIQRMAKKSWLVPNLLMLLRIHKLKCVCHYQLAHTLYTNLVICSTNLLIYSFCNLAMWSSYVDLLFLGSSSYIVATCSFC
jgi:hypothetical protein